MACINFAQSKKKTRVVVGVFHTKTGNQAISTGHEAWPLLEWPLQAAPQNLKNEKSSGRSTRSSLIIGGLNSHMTESQDNMQAAILKLLADVKASL